MKKSIIYFLGLILVSCTQKEEKQYKIDIDLSGFGNETTLVLNKKDSIKSGDKNIVFSVPKIKAAKEYSIQVFTDSLKKPLTGFSFWFENVDVSVKGNWSSEKKDFTKMTFEGGEFQRIENSFSAVFEKFGKVAKELFASGKPKKEIERTFDDLKKSIKNDFVNLSFKNPDNIISLSKFLTFGTHISKDSITLYYNNLGDILKKSKKGKLLKKLSITKKLQIGDKAENFTAFNIEGKEIQLSDFKGKVILLDFWASWCKPCREQNKEEFVDLYKKYKDEDLIIISYSLDKKSEEKEWKNATKKDSITWVSISNLKGWGDDSLAFQYSVEAVPNSFLIDRNGIIVNSFLDYKKGQHLIEDAIVKLLK